MVLILEYNGYFSFFLFHLFLLFLATDNGHYIYIDQMDQDFRKDVNSYLTSITIRPGTDICFTFWYHMYGENIGTLNVYTESGNTTEIQWSQSGNQGTSWQFAYLDISISEPYRIVFEGISGENDQSDISLDDILLLQRSCSGKKKNMSTSIN